MKEIYRNLESLMTSFEAMDINFIGLHADTIKSEREMVEALSRFRAGGVNRGDHDFKIAKKMELVVGELIEVMAKIKAVLKDIDLNEQKQALNPLSRRG